MQSRNNDNSKIEIIYDLLSAGKIKPIEKIYKFTSEDNQIKIGDINSIIELEKQINNSLEQLDLVDKKENANEIRNSSSWKQIK